MTRPDRTTLPFAVALLVLAASAARADTASPRLARYRREVDAAVDRALAYLAKDQRPDGSFSGSRGQTNAVVALAAMAFLAKGHTPGRGPYGAVINRCIDYVLKHRRANGCLDAGRGGGGMYSHCISTLLLSEVSGMVDPDRQKKIDHTLPRALRIILDAQAVRKPRREQGGWRYQHNSRDSDISVSGWALMALRSARINGAPVPKKAIDDAIRFLQNCRCSNGGFAYRPGGGAGAGRTGAALLCLELTGHHGRDVTKKAGDFILRQIGPKGFLRDRHYYYAVYYCSQAMFQLGGDYWERFAEAMCRHLLRQQAKGGWWRHGGSRAYPTAMSVLALTVVYRQLPIYQR